MYFNKIPTIKFYYGSRIYGCGILKIHFKINRILDMKDPKRPIYCKYFYKKVKSDIFSSSDTRRRDMNIWKKIELHPKTCVNMSK